MTSHSGNWKFQHILFGAATALGLYASSLYSYLLFHSLIELFSVFVAFAIFSLTWHTRRVQDNQYLLFIGTASLFCGVVDMMHTLAYAFQGSGGGFPGYGDDLDTQLWIAFRYLSSASFLFAPFFLDRKFNSPKVATAFGAVTFLLLVSIFAKEFPQCSIEGRGATGFKIFSEYFASLVFLASFGLLYRKRKSFDRDVLRLVLFSLISAALTGLSYSQYKGDTGIANMAGHYFELLSYWLLYRAIVVTGLIKPTALLFRNLKLSEEELKRSEQKYRGLYDSTRDGIGMVDMRGRFIECNQSFADMLGYSPEEMRHLNYEELTPASWHSMEKDIVKRQVLTRGYSDEYEKEYRKKDGTLVPVSVKTWLKKDVMGKRMGMWGIVRDITERKRSVQTSLRYLENLEFLSYTSVHFLRQMSFEEFFEYTGDQLRSIAGRALVVMGEYDAANQCMAIRALHGSGSDLAAMARILGRDPVGLTFAVSPEMMQKLAQGRLTRIEGGIHELAFGQVPPSLCGQLERELNVGEIHIMPFALEEDFLGTAALLLPRQETLLNPRIIESFVNLAAMALKRAKAEDRLKKIHEELEARVRERTAELAETVSSLKIESAERFRAEQSLIEKSKILEAFFQGSMTCLAILDRQFNFVRVNDAYARKAGRFATDFPGRNHFELYPSDEAKASFERVVETKEAFSAAARPFTYPDHPEWGETYWDILLTPLLDCRGDVEFLVLSLNDGTEREKAERALTDHQERLEELVRKRTAQLETANRELEAFAFTVSHDLRAPLRSIEGFSRILEEEQATRLDEAGQDHFRRIRAATGKMNQLIDALLNLSRLTRTELSRAAVNLSALARSVAEDLVKSQPDRLVDFVIADGITAQGDPVMLRIMMENLFGNAWKFTAKRERASIEFGVAKCGVPSAECGMKSTMAASQAVRNPQPEIVFSVRDNGAGFDMAYAGKLFTPFQRLHSASEFPGLGIGLATVHRIVRRHGGSLWAEGNLEQGATFSFTLPDSSPGGAGHVA